MITVGIDSGNRSTKVVVLKDGEVISRYMTLTGFEINEAATEAFTNALGQAGLKAKDVAALASTGVGRSEIKFAQAYVTEVEAAARGARFVVPTVNTIIDLGAEEGRAIKLTLEGKISDFATNEKCAAGAGSFVESMARALQTTAEEMGPLSMKHTKKVPMNAQCVVFAESEVVSLIHQNTAIEDIAKAVHDGVSNRVSSIVRRVGIVDDVALIGGPGKNIGLVQSLSEDLAKVIIVPEYPEFISALGAALYAVEIG
ncbi:acyl-CoA dehydratase activase [Desulfosporosinus sp. BICA1-9]|uniref:acyl-CoA dehydratase activase n=1 Tax=Desulfosporosinus sp. BICA1-9 TaxID=1531958 RepID=UPI00054C2B5C|nr:acyl-CoA dehydratase activase [Desulfosporosinus sp. BICA1-9]KJS85976.1 MAG: CoA activase [Desulfosporosinus sp. BICA1-9]HBW34396.1 CoA activase [Desulfosporosinus sp.]